MFCNYKIKILPMHSSAVTPFDLNIFRITAFLKSLLGSFFPLENLVLVVVFKIQSFLQYIRQTTFFTISLEIFGICLRSSIFPWTLKKA